MIIMLAMMLTACNSEYRAYKTDASAVLDLLRVTCAELNSGPKPGVSGREAFRHFYQERLRGGDESLLVKFAQFEEKWKTKNGQLDSFKSLQEAEHLMMEAGAPLSVAIEADMPAVMKAEAAKVQPLIDKATRLLDEEK